jgi:hypothetical protein
MVKCLKINKNSVTTCIVDMLSTTSAIELETVPVLGKHTAALPVHESQRVHFIQGHGRCALRYLLPSKHSVFIVKSTTILR